MIDSRERSWGRRVRLWVLVAFVVGATLRLIDPSLRAESLASTITQQSVSDLDHESVARSPSSAMVEVSQSGASVSHPVPTSAEDVLIVELTRLKACWRTDTCGFSDDDPKANHFEAVAKMKQSLKELRSIKAARPNADFSDVAREWFQFPDDHVREAALELLREHPRTKQNLQALLEGLSRSSSGVLFRAAIADLVAYQGDGYGREIRGLIEMTLRSGPLNVGEQLAVGVLPLLTDENEAWFVRTANTLPKGSRSRRSLEAALDEFRRRRGNG